MALKKQPKPQRRPETITVTINRTVQLKKFEPLTITVTEVHQVQEGEDPRAVRLQVYNQVATSVASYMNKELERYTEEE